MTARCTECGAGDATHIHTSFGRCVAVMCARCCRTNPRRGCDTCRRVAGEEAA